MASIAILSPGFPGTQGGVTAHTQRLAQAWSDSGHETTVIGDLSDGPEVVVERLHDTNAKYLLVQYVPFLYGRRGLSRVPERIARQARNRDIRVTTFVHEPWVPPTRLPWLVLSPLQRWQLRRLLGLSDAVVTAVPHWGELWRPHTHVVYVGSNLGAFSDPSPVEPILESPVVFSPFASGLRWDWIVAASRALGARLTIVGADENQVLQHPAVGRWFHSEWQCLGWLDARDVLSTLARAPLVFAPFVDGATGRRGSLLAAASTGARILSSTGHLYDPFFDSSPIHIASSRPHFVKLATELWRAPDTAEERGARLDWYGQRVDPVRLDTRLLEVVLGGSEK